MGQKTNTKGLAARILGEQPTAPQNIFVWFMVLTLLLWQFAFFMSIFFWDAPIQSSIDAICRLGLSLTIWLYPIYLFPLIRLWFKLSKKLGMIWMFYLCPLIPMAVFYLFLSLASSAYAERKPEGYDPSTYKRLNETYAIDINHVYYEFEVLEGADPATFVAPKDDDNDHLAHDNHDYYIGKTPLHVADMSSFRYMGSNWAIDSINIYYIANVGEPEKYKIPVGDYHTFRVLNIFYAADDKNVYYENMPVKDADPSSFAVLEGEYHYAKDKNRVYCNAYGSAIRELSKLKHKNMEDGLCNAFHTDGKTVYNPKLMTMPKGTDFATIHKVESYSDWYADSKHVYYENHLLSGANPKTFEIFPSHYVNEDYVSDINKDTDYSHDGSHVYYRDSLMSGVDIASFVCGYDYVAGQAFAFDKNRYYQGSPNPRIEKLRQGKH